MVAPAPAQAVVVTGTARAGDAEAETITNVQERGVDEGDIIKRIGNYLIALQDGRLFSIDLRAPEGLALVDRENVYRNTSQSYWIDEMLVFDNRIVVIGYSYRAQATELSIFTLSDTGQIAREAVYFVSSNDYYDPENYATRIIGDNLVFYVPVEIRDLGAGESPSWPRVRRWLGDDAGQIQRSDGRPLIDATDVHRPLLPSEDPIIHALAICPLGQVAAGDELECRGEAFIAPRRREFYVTPEAIYLWALPSYADVQRYGRLAEACENKPEGARVGYPGVVYRAPIAGGEPSALFLTGEPLNNFAMAAADGEFRALARQQCTNDLTYLSAQLSDFRRSPRGLSAGRYTPVPTPENGTYEVRFTEEFLVYGTRSDWGTQPPQQGRPVAPARVIAVSTKDPADQTVIESAHQTIRLERVGDDMVLTGYRTNAGLSMSYLELSGTPRLSHTTVLQGRYETEGRSHAFNSRVVSQEEAWIGLPTGGYGADPRRRPWESADSDVTFVQVTDSAGFHLFGHLTARPNAVDARYRCEVSCVDWYGNARPIFTDGRIFALTGSELVEGRIDGRALAEVRRVNLTAPPQPRG